MLAGFHVGSAELEIGEIDLMFEFGLAHEKVTGLDVSVQQLVSVEVFDSFEDLDANHKDCF
jgi:hypothetical protein